MEDSVHVCLTSTSVLLLDGGVKTYICANHATVTLQHLSQDFQRAFRAMFAL